MRPVVFLLTLMLFALSVIWFDRVGAQATRPTLISHADSTRAIAFESVTRQREPFQTTVQVKFGADSATRIMLFAMNLQLQPGETAIAVTADAEDAAHTIYSLTVEHVGGVPDQPWASSLVVRLPSNLPLAGDVLVRIRYGGVASNRVRVGIGHVGDGPPDDTGAVPTPGLIAPGPPTGVAATNLNPSDVQTILQQAASAAAALGKPVNIVVTDREANVLGFFAMSGAPATTTVRSVGTLGQGLEGGVVPADLAATAKAATAAFFSTTGNAFTTRTAGFIIQEHFPPGISFRAGGPLYGVQFSSLPCGDIKKPSARLGLSADPGGLPIYKNGLPAGGIGIEGDGLYTVDRVPTDDDQPFEELIAASAIRGFEAPPLIRGDNILVDGIRLPFSNVTNPPAPTTTASIAGATISFGPGGVPPDSEFVPQVVGGIAGEVSPRFFPFIAGTTPAGPNALTASDVNAIISHAAQQSNITRAAIRQPLGSNARVSIAVVDTAGVVLGVFRQQDAPVFGYDVAVQKARTAAFFSSANAATALRAAGFGSYVDRANADGLRFDGAFAFSDRAIGFLHRPFFPDGINDTAAGPFSTARADWSPFNVGLQLDLVRTNFLASLAGPVASCAAIPGLTNGIQIFAGSVPLYKNGVLVGAIGISGDGIDQDDLIAAAGANGFSPPAEIRSDQIFVRSVRLPFVKFPRSPNL
ncbi:MAG TPA: heme-binding protein [Pyrinomonadaceae bacterium]|nr:heme-binding protein [Pyrinomonadaceae bacterium]